MNLIQAAGAIARLGHLTRGSTPVRDLILDLFAGKVPVADMIAAFQRFHGLAETGELDGPTVALLKQPRCLHPDVLASGASPCKWPDRNVTWHQRITLAQLPADRVAALYAQAWNQWAAVCGLNPIEVRDATPDKAVNVYARTGQGIPDQFDQAGTILAWSQLPCGVSVGSTLNQVFNAAEPWSESMFLAVACHEVGHAIGLPHIPGKCLMNPYYDPSITAPQPADVAEAVARYGAPSAPDPAPAPTPGPGQGTPVPSPSNAVQILVDVTEPGKYLLSVSMAKQT